MKRILILLSIVFLFLQFDYGFAAKAGNTLFDFVENNLSNLSAIKGQLKSYREMDSYQFQGFMKMLIFKVMADWTLIVKEHSKISVPNFENFIKYLDEIKKDASLWDNVKDFKVPFPIEKDILELSVDVWVKFFEYYNSNAKHEVFGKTFGFFGTAHFTERVETVYQRFLKTPEQIAAAEKEKTEKTIAPLKKGLVDLKQLLSTLKAKLGTLDSKLVALKSKFVSAAK